MSWEQNSLSSSRQGRAFLDKKSLSAPHSHALPSLFKGKQLFAAAQGMQSPSWFSVTRPSRHISVLTGLYVYGGVHAR